MPTPKPPDFFRRFCLVLNHFFDYFCPFVFKQLNRSIELGKRWESSKGTVFRVAAQFVPLYFCNFTPFSIASCTLGKTAVHGRNPLACQRFLLAVAARFCTL